MGGLGLHDVAALDTGDGPGDPAGPRRLDGSRVQAPGDDGHRHAGARELANRRDIRGVDGLVSAQERAVEVDRQQPVRHGPHCTTHFVVAVEGGYY